MSLKKKRSSNSFWIDSLTGEKYESKKLIPDRIPQSRLTHWDSHLEYSCYHKLRSIFPENPITRQEEIRILPGNDIFLPVSWNVDFQVKLPERNLFVECKGMWISKDREALGNFTKLLRLLFIYELEVFQNLLIVSNEKFSLGRTKVPIITFEELKQMYAK